MVLYRISVDKDIVGRMCNEWKETKEMLQYIDVIVDGKYEEDKKDMMLQFKGSSNQRTILVKESLESGKYRTSVRLII